MFDKRDIFVNVTEDLAAQLVKEVEALVLDPQLVPAWDTKNVTTVGIPAPVGTPAAVEVANIVEGLDGFVANLKFRDWDVKSWRGDNALPEPMVDKILLKTKGEPMLPGLALRGVCCISDDTWSNVGVLLGTPEEVKIFREELKKLL